MMRAGAAMTALLTACGFSPPGAAAPTDPDAAGPAVDAPFPVGAPRAYWSFDVDARDVMSARHPRDAGRRRRRSPAGARWLRRGEALRLVGSEGDRVDVGAAFATLDFNRDFTWHVYVRTTDGLGGAVVAQPCRHARGTRARRRCSSAADTVQWDSGWVSNPRTGVTRSTTATWHQVIATYVAATDSLDVFVDPATGATTAGQYSGSARRQQVRRAHPPPQLSGVADTGFSIGAANFTGGLNGPRHADRLRSTRSAVFDRALQGPELDRLIAGGPAAFLE
jgi:hypothetical protein